MDDDCTDGFYLIGESPLEMDEEEDVRAEYLPSAEEALRLLGRDNRVAIVARKPMPATSPFLPPGRAAYDITLMLVLHAHPECKFKWSRLIIDLAPPSPEVIIEEMAPTEVAGEPVEVETQIGAGLTLFKAVSVQLTPEVTRKRTIHFPTVSASGKGTSQAYWTFQASEGDYIPSNQELQLLVSAPAHASVAAKFLVRAEVELRGWKKLFPLRAKHGGLDAALPLVAAPNP
jgi:hypothetical protein